MPESFVLEVLTDTGDWSDHGWYGPEVFARDDDGAYICGGNGGSPLFLRCLRQDGSVIYVVDAAGDPFTYRMRPVDGDGPGA